LTVKDTRQKILAAAESIMSAKGRNATISEISTAADVADAVLYYYFKNKEDLLFSVTQERLGEALEKLKEQLQGIMDPANQISKLIWFQLYYHDTHRDYAHLLLFECRSNKSFMEHSAYNLIKRWSAIGRKIIKKGIADGSFRKDLSLSVVRDAIFGLVDIENIQSMAANETPQANTDLEAILDLVLPMIRADAPEASLKDDKEGRILNAAQNLFGDKGFQGATVQEIAKASEVSEGTIYEYFKNKEDLLFSVLKRQFRNNLESMDELFEIRTPLRKLRRFVRYHFTISLPR